MELTETYAPAPKEETAPRRSSNAQPPPPAETPRPAPRTPYECWRRSTKLAPMWESPSPYLIRRSPTSPRPRPRQRAQPGAPAPGRGRAETAAASRARLRLRRAGLASGAARRTGEIHRQYSGPAGNGSRTAWAGPSRSRKLPIVSSKLAPRHWPALTQSKSSAKIFRPKSSRASPQRTANCCKPCAIATLRSWSGWPHASVPTSSLCLLCPAVRRKPRIHR